MPDDKRQKWGRGEEGGAEMQFELVFVFKFISLFSPGSYHNQNVKVGGQGVATTEPAIRQMEILLDCI